MRVKHEDSRATPSTGPQPLSPTALQGLLLTPDEINAAMGVTGIVVIGPSVQGVGYADDPVITDKACQAVNGAATVGSPAYVGSGWNYARSLELARGDNEAVTEAVVSFPSAEKATAFFADSAQAWPACSNTRFKNSWNVWNVEPVSNIDGILRTSYSAADSPSNTCRRALTVAGSVAIDVRACASADLPGDAAVNIAHQIAAKAPTG
jgi:hypothetical protein